KLAANTKPALRTPGKVFHDYKQGTGSMLNHSELFSSARPIFGFFPIALAFIAAELAYLRLANHDHDTRETAASLGVALGDIASRLLTGGLIAIPFYFVYQHRLFEVPLDRPSSWAALFIGVEFFYYWFHRASHRIRWFWATHAVHHSAV